MKKVGLEDWYSALASPFGVALACEGDPEKVRQKLYRLRTDAKDPDLDQLSVVTSPTDPSHLWIVKKDGAKEPTK